MGNDGSDKQQGSRQRNRGGLSCKVVIFGKGAGESSEQPLGMALRKGAKGEAVVAAPPPRKNTKNVDFCTKKSEHYNLERYGKT